MNKADNRTANKSFHTFDSVKNGDAIDIKALAALLTMMLFSKNPGCRKKL